MSDPKDSSELGSTSVGMEPTLLGSSPPTLNVTASVSLSADGRPVVLADRYELQALLGEGAMGTVYLARDRELDDRVALKVLRRELWGTPGALDRFRREVRLARRVTHTNVARVFDIGEHERDHFLTMEFIDGASLAVQVAREGRLLVSRAVEVARAVASGLAAAHAAGVLHRDLKPDNVLIEPLSGRTVITDFGVARLLDGTPGVHTTGHLVGTPAYMAPEQLEGRADIDARADLYALGALLYEALTGHRPWSGATIFAMAAARLHEPPPDPRQRLPSLPPALAELVLQLMARDRADRPSSAAEVATRLGALRLPEDATISQPALEQPVLALSPPAGAKALAVLPCRAADPADDFLADGFTEDLIDSLSMVDGLRVRSLGAVLPFKGHEDARRAGRELGVQVVVGSSLRRQGERLRLTARLIGVTDGFQLWAQRFEGGVGDLFRTSDEVAGAIAHALSVPFAPFERRPPSDPRVLELYLRGRQEYHKAWPEHLEVASELLGQAHQLAPDDPVVMSAWALALSRLYALDHASPEAERRARQIAEDAARRAPHLGEPRVALATLALNAGRSEEGARELADALRINPQSLDAQEMLGRVLLEVGRPEAGIERLELVMALEPRSVGLRYDMARVHALLGDWPQADALLEERPVEPSLLARYWTLRARLLMWRSNAERLAACAAELATLRFEFQPAVQALVQLQLAGGDAAAARPLIELIQSRGQRSTTAQRARAFFHQLAAEVAALGGDEAVAVRALERADSLGLLDLVWLDKCPLFEPLRADARFEQVRGRVAARAERVLALLGVS